MVAIYSNFLNAPTPQNHRLQHKITYLYAAKNVKSRQKKTKNGI
jgi:hypothetical protein